MSRKGFQQQVDTAVQPLLTKGEEIRRSGPAWAVEQRGRAPLLFRARDLHHVVLTNQRLILLTRPGRRRPLGVNNLVLAKKFSTFSLEKARRLHPMLQLRVRTSADRVLVLEFRPRDRRVGRELAAELRSNGAATGERVQRALPAGPVPPQPDAPPPPAQPELVRLEPPPSPQPELARFESPASQPSSPAPPPAPRESYPVPIDPILEAPRSESEWHKPDWGEEERERERRTRKEKRAAKKQAKEEAKAARAEQARKEGKLSRKERRREEKHAKKQAKKVTSEHEEMLQYLKK